MRCKAVFCVVLVFALLRVLVTMSDSSDATNSFAVLIRGGEEEADRLAGKHGFKNHGKVSDILRAL